MRLFRRPRHAGDVEHAWGWPPRTRCRIPAGSEDSVSNVDPEGTPGARPVDSVFGSRRLKFLPRLREKTKTSESSNQSGGNAGWSDGDGALPAPGWGTGPRRCCNSRRESGSSAGGPIQCVVVDNDFGSLESGSSEKSAHTEEHLPPVVYSDSASISQTRSGTVSEYSARTLHRWYHALVTTGWSFIKSFAHMGFPDKAQERAFQHERWHTGKPAACAGIFFLLLSTFLAIGFTQHWTTWNFAAYLGVAATFNLTVLVLVILNVYCKAYWVYQLFLLGATWCWPFILAIEINNCGFFSSVNKCGGRTFLNFFAQLAGIPTFSLITLHQNRLLHLLGITAWGMMMIGLFLHEPKADLPMWRNVILASVYHHILVWATFFRERADRQLFSLRSQLKEQYRAVQSAQEMERRAQDSNKRFVAYIFHEVRVPLNTARLALSNLDAEGAFGELRCDQRELILGLDTSLRMMEKVLNDVLSFSRMESGKLTLNAKPFALHQAINHVALAHRASASHLDFTLELDPHIDALGGVFIGDDMRFKQVCSNLISNACKFTRSGGVRLVTRLVSTAEPSQAPVKDVLECKFAEGGREPEYTSVDLRSVDSLNTTAPTTPTTPTVPLSVNAPSRLTRKAIIRVEVHDTGVGLSMSDVRHNRLFSPYVQTEIGRRQGGKGSGLGLALVTQIVKLSRGRLGVDSEPGKGSMFWFEIPFTVPSRVELASMPQQPPQSHRRSGGVLPDISVESDAYIPPPLSTRPLTSTSSTLPSPMPLKEPTTGGAGTAKAEPLAAAAGTDSDLPRSLAEAESIARSLPCPQPPLAEQFKVLTSSPILTLQGASSLSALVVDDDPLTRKLMTRMLTRLGHTVETAVDGRAALDLLTRSYEEHAGSTIDVVFLDNQMPAMSGVEVVRAVRAMGWDLYVVGCTGNALREDQEEYLAAGANAIIPKPISLTAVQEQLGRARSILEGKVPYAG